MRVGALDVGSNTIHLLVVDVEQGVLTEVARTVTMPQLGRQVDAHGAVGTESTAAAVRIVSELRAVADHHGVEALLLGATAAVRRARDAQAVLAAVSAAAGTPCRLISERAEAQLSFIGALHGLAPSARALVVDIGGGSTECAVGPSLRNGGVAAPHSVSIPLGSGTVTARWLPGDPPSVDAVAACAEALDSATEPFAALAGTAHDEQATRGGGPVPPAPAVFCGGTAASLPRLLDGADELDDRALARCRARLATTTSATLAAETGLEPARAGVLAGGVEIVAAVMRRFALQRVGVTSHGLREGMVLRWLEEPEAWWV